MEHNLPVKIKYNFWKTNNLGGLWGPSERNQGFFYNLLSKEV